jgi:pimeloyl-ACP methyl ester carboxylesterase
VLLDLRGTGASAVPTDVASYRCDRQVDDVEELRQHLGLNRMDLLGHSAGANLAVLYATRYPERVRRLALITPSTHVVGISPSGEVRREHARSRADEPWFSTAYAALEAITADQAGDDSWDAITPFFYGRWDATAQAHHAAEASQQHPEAADEFYADGAFDPAVTRQSLASLEAPVLLLAGERDLGAIPSVIREYADLPPHAVYVQQPGAGHFPWLDDPERFAEIVEGFLA